MNVASTGLKRHSVLKSSALSLGKAQKWAFWAPYPAKSSFGVKKLNSELLYFNLFILAYFLKTCRWFYNLDEFLAQKSIHEWKMKKIEGCQVHDFHLSIFLQSKKMIKIHTFTPIFLYHTPVAQTFSQKKKLAHSMRMYGRGKLRKKREKSKSSEMSFSRVSGC